MEIFLAVLLFLVGLALIIYGGDWFVDGAIWVAKKTGIPSIIIGATIVSIGTTIPEICVSTISVIEGLHNAELLTSLSEMAVGNAVGSMMANIALILAIVLCIRPPVAERSGFLLKAIYLTAVTVLLIIFSLTSQSINVVEGAILLVLFVGFIVLNVWEAKRELKKTSASLASDALPAINAETAAPSSGNEQAVDLSDETDITEGKRKKLKDRIDEKFGNNPVFMIFKLILGAACIGIGAKLLVDNGQALAEFMGIPTQIVAITFVAIGTSLPELVTSITSLRKKDSNIGLGNIIGANIINATLLIGLSACISGNLPIDYVTRNAALFVLLAITLVLAVPPVIKQKTYRWQGVALLALYFGFMAYNIYYVAASL